MSIKYDYEEMRLDEHEGCGWFWQMFGQKTNEIYFQSIYYETKIEALEKMAENDVTWAAKDF